MKSNEWIGRWICRDKTEAEVFDQRFGNCVVGVVKICGRDILTLWLHDSGDHFSARELDLIKRKREAEI